ncbi:MAG: carboxypeptidase regulatory-like domain-containing protein [Myxococcaceae bacterium]|nr:carboxypeptidase regulatory-like domain-containing protein [Myxococcaceae bacterium]
MNGLLILTLCAAAGGSSDDVFSKFDGWAKEYRQAPTDLRRSELKWRGVELAAQRAAALRRLIRENPEAALKHAAKRDRMPDVVANLLEEEIEGIGRYEVLGVLKHDHSGGIERWLVLGSHRYRVTAWGPLEGMKTVEQISVKGIALGAEAAITTATRVQHINSAQASPWTTGTKPLRYMRVDFSDAPGDPQTLANAQGLTTQLNTYLFAASYQQTQIVATVVPMTLRMPRTQAAYGASGDTTGLLNDAKAAATMAGFPPMPNGLDVVAFRSVPGFGFAGLGMVGSSGTWLNGSFSLGTLAHEVGHNLGLYHANFWEAGGESVIGAGNSIEYGNPFEIMGNGDGHYSAWYKYDLDWFRANEVSLAAAPTSTHRLFDLEQPITSGAHAVRVPIGATRDYWLEFRPAEGDPSSRGAIINWGYSQSTEANLLDLTPWTNSERDSALVVGRTFSDFTAGIHITVTAVQATMPASLDVTVNRGLFPTNRAPIVSVACTPTGQQLDCTATASDPDGDGLAYYWDFGDVPGASTNQATQTRTISGSRDVLARVTVSDMRGGTATASAVTTFGTPTTFRVTGTVTENGVGVEGVRVFSGPSRMTWTNSDGTYTLVGMPAGPNSVQAVKAGWSFAPGFTNPVTVTMNTGNVNFVGSRATFTISGRITSVGQGFAGATVSAGTYTTLTNANGDYTLTGVPAGAYNLTATGPNNENFIAQGFTNPIQITTQSLTNRNFIELVFPVSGVVTGSPGPHFITDGVRNTLTVQNGAEWRWTLPKVPPGSWNLLGRATGQLLTPVFSNPVTVSTTGMTSDGLGMPRASFDFVAAPGTGYMVSGYVDEAGGPSLSSIVDAGFALGTTDSRGIYVIPNLPAGAYTLSAGKPGFVFGPGSIDVTLPNPDGGSDWYGADFILLMGNVPPVFSIPPHANPSPVTANTCSLVTLGRDPIEDESTLKYTWTQVFGPSTVTFNRNGTNGAKNATATFDRPGTYSFDVKLEDLGGLFVTSNVTLAVVQTTTTMQVVPATAMVELGTFRQFVASARDQFNQAIDIGAEATWTVTPPTCGTITATGRFTPQAAGMCTLTAAYDGKMGSATVDVRVGAAPRVTAGPTANPSPITTGNSTQLSVTADDDEGEAQLSYTWRMVNGPAGVAFSPNNSNLAKASTATFSAHGTYDLQVEIKDSRDITTSAFITVVVEPGGVARLEVTGPSSVEKGKTGQFTATAFDLANTSVALTGCTWSTTAGTIDMTGLLTLAQAGSVTLTCGTVADSVPVAETMVTDPPKMGCGCGSAEGALVLAALGLLARRRRRV